MGIGLVVAAGVSLVGAVIAAGGSMGPCPSDPDTGNLRDDLVILIGSLTATMATPVGALLPATIDESARNPELRTRLDAFVDARREPVRAALGRADARGELWKGIDRELVADLLAGPVFTRVLITGVPIDHGFAARVVDTVLSGVFARPRVEG
ncbi:MAG: TetR/AcrR family transcriptional regulator C-terminal ligand-binding domain-containing protein [Actinobacteria bacterium]|nr:TetR/AcrR family transcriptional regulator C-terminal ligand-binding domain-containing protein [Actinomycetota bacterium]MBW3643235.1 TetR/AcrR family transcriptional regulator C-terminal ligand-binding domain-containing protein [Actinomycetota bacterium]